MSQPRRLIVAAGYVVILTLLGLSLTGSVPSFGLEGLWLYAAAATVFLNSALQEPHYTRPADALVNGIALLLAITAMDPSQAVIMPSDAEVIRVSVGGYAAVVIAAAVTAIMLKDGRGWLSRISGQLSRLLRQAGRATLLFGILYFAAIWLAYATNPRVLYTLAVAWSVIFAAEPLERLTRAIGQRRSLPVAVETAVIETLEDPQLVELRLPAKVSAPLGSRVEFADLDLAGVVVGSTRILSDQRARVVLDKPHSLTVGQQVRIAIAPPVNHIAGFVGPGSSLEEIVVISVAAADDARDPAVSDEEHQGDLAENRLLSVSIGPKAVLYQVVDGVVAVSREPGARRGHFEVHARKLGCWNDALETFESVEWLPNPGAPVYFVSEADAPPFDERWIGRVPDTRYGVGFDVHGGVTHNTAILGILGIGKTTLAWELLNRMVDAGVKVLVLDTTGQYQREFAALFSDEEDARIRAEIDAAIAATRENRRVVDGEAGNVAVFKEVVVNLLGEFVDGTGRFLVINPLAFDVTRIDIKSFDEPKRTLIGLTAAEVTRIVAEALLDVLRARFTQDDGEAKLCLVLEEAHSLVPEWNAAAEKSEEHAVVGTVRAVLQGRKYGFGCLVITQRTAHVTKSLLNQCNSIIAMRVFDATGMDFLANYVGRRYTGLLATLQPQEGVVFGRAFRSTVPLIVRFNHRWEEFLPGYWDRRAAGIPPTSLAREPVAEPTVETDVDDIPF